MSERFDHDDAAEARPTFEEALAALSNDHENLPGPVVLYGFSDMTDAQLAQLQPVWNQLDTGYRRILMQMLVDVSEQNFELNYRALGYANLSAPEAEIRQAAIELLWEDNSLYLMQRLIRLAKTDPAVEVQVEAIKALGRFVLMGELGDLDARETRIAEEALLAFIHDPSENALLQRHALEAVANCSRADVTPLIREAYRSKRGDIRQSAIVAMGHTCDAESWTEPVLEELANGDADMQLVAVRAAGELQLEDAVSDIVRILADGEREVQEVGIWALGEIGGRQATKTLETLSEAAETSDDDELAALVEDALANAALASGDLMMIDFSTIED